MNLSLSATDRVYGAVEDLRARHWELRQPLTWEVLRVVLSREGVLLGKVPLGRPAKLVGYEGLWVILVDRDRPVRHLWYAAHEFAHLKLHVECDPTERYECCYHMDDLLADDPREHEADLLTELLIYGWER